MRLTLVEDHADAPLTFEKIAASRQAADTVVIEVAPGTKRLSWVARELLLGLGKARDSHARATSTDEDWACATAWAQARGVRRLLVWRAHLLLPKLVGDLVQLTATLDASLTAVVQPREVNRPLREAFASWGFERIDVCAWRPAPARTEVEPPVGPADSPAPPAVTVPEVDWPYFRAMCEAELPPDQRAAVDAEYREALCSAAELFADSSLTPNTIHAYVSELLQGAPEHVRIVRLRALQASAFLYGWHLSVRLGILLPSVDDGASAPRWTPDVAAVLDGQSHPLHSALGVVLATSRTHVTDALRMTVNDLVHEESELRFTCGDTSYTLPAVEHLGLLAYLYWRRANAIGDDEPLWVTGTAHSPLTRGVARGLLSTMSTLTGARFNAFNRGSVSRNLREHHGLVLRRIAA